MSAQPTDDSHEPRRRSREEHLAEGRPLPPLEDSVIDDFTEEEWGVFWMAINQA